MLSEILYEANTELPVVIIDNKNFDIHTTNIQGTAIKLQNLGWMPRVSVEEILNELIK